LPTETREEANNNTPFSGKDRAYSWNVVWNQCIMLLSVHTGCAELLRCHCMSMITQRSTMTT